jgi:indolepyruvate ferredoxin oxidoreductase alpha subunit
VSAQVHPAVSATDPPARPRPGGDLSFALLAAAVREHVQRVVVVPGKPVHLLRDQLPDAAVIEAADEKSGFEHAMGLALGGVPAAALFKGVGVSHAWDSITNAVVHGTVDGGPVLIVAADDTVAGASTVIVDSRALAATADLAVVEPCTIGHIADAVALAATMSTTVGEPVMVRYTPELAALAAAAGIEDVSQLPAAPADDGDSPRVVPMPGLHRAHGLTKPGRHVHRHRFSMPVLTALADGADLIDEHRGSTVLPGFGRTAIIGFGPSWSTVGRPTAEALDLHGMGSSVVYPLPGRLVEFASRFDTVLVVEEGRPVAESALTLALADLGARTAVLGRRGGALPAVGTLHVSDLHRALEGDRAVDDRVPLWKEGGKPADEPYRSLFDAVAVVRRRHGVGVATCVGTVIDVAGAPWHSVDLALSLGSATGSAAGMAEAGRRSLALIGDYGLLHSGLNAFGTVQRRGLPVLTVIVANGVSKRTGGQRSAFHPDEPHAIELLGELRARGARHVRVIDGDTADADGLAAAIEAELDRLPATIVIETGEGFHRSAVGVARPGCGDRGTS